MSDSPAGDPGVGRPPGTRVDRYLARLKDHRALSLLIVAGVVFLGLVSFGEGIKRAGALFGAGQAASQYDVGTKEAVIAVARKSDMFLLELREFGGMSATNRGRVMAGYLDIEADLASIALRTEAVGADPAVQCHAREALAYWQGLRERMNRDGGAPYAQPAREALSQHFRAVLRIEGGLRDTP